MTSKLTPVKESRFGLYVWLMPNGQLVANENFDFLNIPSVEGDVEKIKILRDTVRHYGITEGRPVFQPGRRRVTDEELEEQKMRLKFGLTPDPYDAPALLDELNERKQNG